MRHTITKAINKCAKLIKSTGEGPPYEHVVQIGDPCLRTIANQVPVTKIRSREIKNVLGKLEYILDKYGCGAISAPQIGVNFRIFVMRFTEKQLAAIDDELIKLQNMKIIPFTIFINPALKIVDHEKVVLPEACASIKGYVADVARFKTVEVTGYNQHGNPHYHLYTGWPARIAQHAFHHLDGTLFTDIMDAKTLRCVCWKDVNKSKGKILLPFSPE